MPRPVRKATSPRVPAANDPARSQSAPPAAPRTIILHFHIFKNAGTTLDAALRKNLGAGWMEIDGDDPNNPLDWSKALAFIAAHPAARAVSSHTLRFPPPPPGSDLKLIPLVLIRHPIDRLASIYYFERHHVEVSHPETSRVARTGSLAAFVEFVLAKRPELGCDTQTSLLARAGVYHFPPVAKDLRTAQTIIASLPVPGVVEQLDRYLATLEVELAGLIPQIDLACPDENRNQERAPSLLARLRSIRAQLPVSLWQELCRRNQLDLGLWQFAHRRTRTRFSAGSESANHLADFVRRKASVSLAPLPAALTDPPPDLPWTGERVVEAATGDFVGEHLHRYALAVEFATGCDVLDVACGEGYGAAFLAKVARQVIGVDRSEPVIAHATKKYPAKNLRFVTGLAEQLPLPAGSIDLVVSFETLEHLADHQAMLGEIKRVLRPNGRLLISTPDREPYRTVSGQINPFHVRELSLPEFEKLLGRHFSHVAVAYQKSTNGSWIAPIANRMAGVTEYSGDFHQVTKNAASQGAPYLIALASDATVPVLPSSFFKNPQQSVELQSLQRELVYQQEAFARLKKELDKRTAWARSLDVELLQARTAFAAESKRVAERSDWGQALEKELRSTQANFEKLSAAHAERTAWALALEAELLQARAALADQARLADERLAWSKSLDADLQAARRNFEKLSATHAERTLWAQSLEADLLKAREALAAQARLADERLAWSKSLDADLQAARRNFEKLSATHAERTTWAQSLEAELLQARSAFAERTTWAQSLEAELLQARSALAERTVWAQSLEADLSSARHALAAQTELFEERSDWGRSVEKELRSTQNSFEKLTREHADRTAWALSLQAELETAHAASLAQQGLARQLKDLKTGCAALAAMLPEISAPDEAALLDHTRMALADLRRALAEKNAAARAAEGSTIDARLQAEAAEHEVERLKSVLADAQSQVDRLLAQSRGLQLHVAATGAEKQAVQKTLDRREHELSSSMAELHATRLALARYESRWICRFAARMAGTAPVNSPPS